MAVGSAILWSKNWKTFHDFLVYYPKIVFGSDWGTMELKRGFAERHPVLQWYELVCRYQKETIKTPGLVHEAPMTGAVAAYLGLSYNLYLLAHNVKLQQVMVNRLKNQDQFRGALYETFVAAAFIKAGFSLQLENESDSLRSHCEFTAIFDKTGARFSVEAKARATGKHHADVGNQLHKALSKKADFTRVIFIDVNMPDDGARQGSSSILEDALSGIRAREKSLLINGSPAPPAYVVITNHPYHYNLETTLYRCAALAEGFRMPDFKMDAQFSSIRDIIRMRERHSEMLALMASIREHYEIPSTFDGEMPELAFGTAPPRLCIGREYLIPIDGKEVVGELIDATISEKEKAAYGVYRLKSGQSVIVTCPITDEEQRAYLRYPDTFFGVYRPEAKVANSPIQLFDFFYESYHDSPRTELLEFMKGAPDYDALTQLSQEELAITYCERMAYSADLLRMKRSGEK